jgi:drug/metabolite transporter (DMT)-like permease
MVYYIYTHRFSFQSSIGDSGGSVEMSLTQPGSLLSQNTSQVSGNSTASASLSNETIGFFLLLGNTICMAVYVLIQKRFIFKSKTSRWKKYPIMVTAWSYGFGAFAMGLSTIYFYQHPDQFVLPGTAWYALVYAVFITSALCYLLITWANLHLPSTIVTAFWPVQVPVAMITAGIFLHEVIAPLQYIGTALVVCGLFLVIISNHWETKYQEKLDAQKDQQMREKDLEKEPLLLKKEQGAIQ